MRCLFGWLLVAAACANETDTSLQLETGALTAAAVAIAYDRDDRTRLEPFPDDYFLVSDPGMPTGQRLVITPPVTSPGVSGLLESLVSLTEALDGMSPLAPIVVPLPAAVDPESLPLTAAASLKPDASIVLIDVDEASPEHGRRVPFYASVRSGPEANGSISHTLLVFSAKPLRRRGRYAFAITRAARSDDGHNLGPSRYMQQLLAGSRTGPAQQRVDALLAELERAADPIPSQDIALLLSLTIGSMEGIQEDLLRVREQLQAAPAPTFRVIDVKPQTGDIAAIVTGEWYPLSFRDGPFLARGLGGRPRALGVSSTPFTLALPNAALHAPVPVVMYQHGHPGSAEKEVPIVAAEGLAAEGFAVLGFTDLLNREIAPDGASAYVQLFLDLMLRRRMPDYLSLLTLSEQLAFLRLLPTLGSFDVLPVDQPDGRPEVDPRQSLGYLGISGGAQQGVGLLAFAPEIRAADLSAAAGRLSSLLVEQLADPGYETLSALLPELTRAQLYTAISLLQLSYDAQDPQNLARFAFREPLQLNDAARACVLLVEGIADPLVPVSSTRSGAWQLDLLQLEKAADRVEVLPSTGAPLRCDAGRHGAFFQYVPRGLPGLAATPGCLQPEWGDNGHRCAHHAAEALHQRRVFFRSALTGAPEIIDPLP